MRKFAIAATVLAATLCGGTAQAAITIYTSQTSYLAAVSNTGVDTFNNLTPGAQLAASLNRTAGSYAYTVTDVATAGGTAALYGAGTATDAWLSNNQNASTITFNGFGSGVRGAGANFFGTDINGTFTAGAGNGLTLTATDASGTVTTTTVNPTTTTFIGFVSTTGLTGMSVRATTGGAAYWATVNNLTLGGTAATAVPEPASWAMMIVGVGLVGGSLRRRKSAIRTSVRFA